MALTKLQLKFCTFHGSLSQKGSRCLDWIKAVPRMISNLVFELQRSINILVPLILATLYGNKYQIGEAADNTAIVHSTVLGKLAAKIILFERNMNK